MSYLFSVCGGEGGGVPVFCFSCNWSLYAPSLENYKVILKH